MTYNNNDDNGYAANKDSYNNLTQAAKFHFPIPVNTVSRFREAQPESNWSTSAISKNSIVAKNFCGV